MKTAGYGSKTYGILKSNTGENMDNQSPKLGKKGGLREVVKILSEIRKKPLLKEVHEIVRENYERNQVHKKIAKPSSEVDL